MAVDQRSHSLRRGGRLLDAIRHAEANWGQSPPGLAPGDRASAAFMAANSLPAVPIEPVSELKLSVGLSLAGLAEQPASAPEDLYPSTEPPVAPIVAPSEASPTVATVRTDLPRIKLKLPRWPEIEELAKTIAGSLPELGSSVLALASVDRLAAGHSVAAPLARAFAARHGEVLLVETDVSSILRGGGTYYQPKPGFAEICTQQMGWSEAVLPTAIERLSYLPAGLELRAFPVDGGFVSQLFASFKQRFKHVVLDAGMAADALAAGWLAPCDEIYLAVELGRTVPHRAHDVARQIVAAGGKIRGSIALDSSG